MHIEQSVEDISDLFLSVYLVLDDVGPENCRSHPAMISLAAWDQYYQVSIDVCSLFVGLTSAASGFLAYCFSLSEKLTRVCGSHGRYVANAELLASMLEKLLDQPWLQHIERPCSRLSVYLATRIP